MKWHNFELQPGYAEDARLCTMKVGHQDGFDGIEEAMEDFRLTRVSYLKKNQQPPEHSCCKKAIKSKANYCPKCGFKLANLAEVTPYEVGELFFRLFATTIDEANDVWLHFDNADWRLGGPHPDHVRAYKGHSDKLVQVQGVRRWMEREEGDRPWMEGTYPNGDMWNSRDGVEAT